MNSLDIVASRTDYEPVDTVLYRSDPVNPKDLAVHICVRMAQLLGCLMGECDGYGGVFPVPWMRCGPAGALGCGQG